MSAIASSSRRSHEAVFRSGTKELAQLVGELVDRLLGEGVEDVVARAVRLDEAGLAQDPQVLGETGFGDCNQRGKLLRRSRRLRDQPQRAQPGVITERSRQPE